MGRSVRLVMLVTVGCGSAAPTVPPRLQVPTYSIDGAEQIQFSEGFGARYYYDAARQEPCTPASWDDGTVRCTPTLPVDGEDPYVFTQDMCPLPRFSQLAAANGDTFVASDFVEITLSGDLSAGGSLGLRIDDYEGGSHVPFGFFDQRAGADCTPVDGAPVGTAVVCQPLAYSVDEIDEYEDDACATAPVMAIPHQCGQVTNLVGTVLPNLLAAVNASPTHVKVPQHSAGPPPPCAALSSIPDADYFQAGSAVTPVMVTRSIEDGSNRIRRIDASDGTVQLPDGLYDQTLDAECTIRLVADGSYRCVPFGVSGRPALVQAFGDAQCTQPIDVVDSDAFGLTINAEPSYGLDTDGVVTALVGQGTPYPGPLFYQSANNGCYSSSVPMFTPGSSIDLGSLAEATLTHD